MLPRLKHRREFLRTANVGKKRATPGLVLQACPVDATNVPADALRVGFTVSKKVGNSVVRNRARRRLRAVAEEVIAAHAASGYDYVLIGRRGTLDRPYPALVQDLEESLRHLNVYRDGEDPNRNRIAPE